MTERYLSFSNDGQGWTISSSGFEPIYITLGDQGLPDALDAGCRELLRVFESGPLSDTDYRSIGGRLYELVKGLLPGLRSGDRIWLSGPVSAPTGACRFDSLPWETLHDADSFLVDRGISIARRPSGGTLADVRIKGPLRVLFVVAADMKDRSIAAGAEFAAILAGDTRRRRLDVRVVSEIGFEELQSWLHEFKPHVLHWVGHGVTRDGVPALQMKSANDPMDDFDAETLELLFKSLPEPPVFLVLNACLAGGSMKTIGRSLAASLVRSCILKGAVGMQGSIGDLACRIFARRFYETLSAGGDVADAVKAGRGAARISGRSVSGDWPRPALYLSEDCGSIKVTACPVASALQARCEQYDRSYLDVRDPDNFLDRLEIMGKCETALRDGQPRFIILHSIIPRPSHPFPPGPAVTLALGRTRILDELALRMIRLDRPVLYVRRDPDTYDWPPKTAPGLVRALLVSMRKLAAAWALAPGSFALERVGPTANKAEVASALVVDTGWWFERSKKTPVLMFDDVDQYGAAAELLYYVLARASWASECHPQVVLSGSQSYGKPEDEAARSEFRAFLERHGQHLVLDVGKFSSNVLRLVITQMLLATNQMPRDAESEAWLSILARFTQSVPGGFNSGYFRSCVDVLSDQLCPTDDRALIDQYIRNPEE